MQTLRAGCSKVEPKIFAPPQTPFPAAWDGQNLISWRWSLPLPTNPVWWGLMHAISSYRGNRPTHPQTNKQTGPITRHCTTASMQCNNYAIYVGHKCWIWVFHSKCHKVHHTKEWNTWRINGTKSLEIALVMYIHQFICLFKWIHELWGYILQYNNM